MSAEDFAAAWLLFLIVTAIVLLILLYTDRLPFPKKPPEPTPMQREMAELGAAFAEIQSQIGAVMRPEMEKIAKAISRTGKP